MDSDESYLGTPRALLEDNSLNLAGSLGNWVVGRVWGQDEEKDSAFKIESILLSRTFTVEKNEKVILTIETEAFANLVDVFSKDPYIYVTQTSRFNSGAFKALWAAIQLPAEYNLRVPIT